MADLAESFHVSSAAHQEEFHDMVAEHVVSSGARQNAYVAVFGPVAKKVLVRREWKKRVTLWIDGLDAEEKKLTLMTTSRFRKQGLTLPEHLFDFSPEFARLGKQIYGDVASGGVPVTDQGKRLRKAINNVENVPTYYRRWRSIVQAEFEACSDEKLMQACAASAWVDFIENKRPLWVGIYESSRAIVQSLGLLK